MVDRLRIFISHSSRDNALTEQVCQHIEAAAPGRFQLLVDVTTLESGQAWPRQLHEMMADCHAAVVLLTAAAVESPWVLKEATILAWRCALEPAFKLFVVQFPEVTAEQLRAARYEPLQHRLLQGVAPGDAQQIGERIAQTLLLDQPQPVRTVLDQMVAGVADVLGQVSPKVLEAVAARLGIEHPRWRPGRSDHDQWVERIACGVLRDTLGSYGGVADLMNDLKATRLSNQHLLKLLRFSAPHWVDPEAASHLEAQPGPGARGFRAVAIDSKQRRDYTPRMYVLRAFPFASSYSVHSPTPAAAGNALEHYSRSICGFCRKEDERRSDALYEGMSDDEIVTELTREKPWLFVALPPIDGLALADLRDRFPRVRFIIDAGSAVHRSEAFLLSPAVDHQREEKALYDYREAIKVCTNP